MGKEANDEDRISQLPDSILSLILSSLPTKDAVSTSILSTRWQHLFASIFNLDLNLDMFWRHSPLHTVMSFTNFMDKLLFSHTEGRIEQFRLIHVARQGIDSSSVCEWISAALCRGVKVIDFVFVFPRYNNIPLLPTNVLFTCKTLVRLKLYFPFLMTVPSHVCLPSLKTLELRFIKFEDDDSIKRLFSSCPVLEDLSIFYCDRGNITWFTISNPSLKSLTLVFNGVYPYPEIAIAMDLPSLVHFKYVGFRAKHYSMGNKPSLVTTDIDISFGHLPYSSDSFGFVKLFEGIGNVKSLHLRIDPLALPFLSHQRFVEFQYLLYLEVDGSRMKPIGKGLFEFLDFLPNLQTLVLCKVANEYSFTKVPSCVVYQLKEFKVRWSDSVKSLFKIVSYILKKCNISRETHGLYSSSWEG